MESISVQYYKSPLGELILGTFEEKLCLCDWRYRKSRNQVDHRIKAGLKAEFVEGTSEIAESSIQQLKQYFDGRRKSFEIPLLPVGTNFQKQVWEELRKTNFGTTQTYHELSSKLGKIKAIRAVAAANAANALSILIPCHRIVGSKGEMVGYAGGLTAKKRLLELEGFNVSAQLPLFD